MAELFDVSEVLLRLESDEFGLSSGEESDFEGEEIHGYLPVPSGDAVSDIGDADPLSTALSDSAHESDDDAASEHSAEYPTEASNSRSASQKSITHSTPSAVTFIDISPNLSFNDCLLNHFLHHS